MADGLFNLCGERVTELTKDGRTYKFAVRPLSDYALKESAILEHVGNPWAGVDSIADPAVRNQAMKLAADAASRPLIATMTDEDRFDKSFRGMAWAVWRALCVNHPTEFPSSVDLKTGIELGMRFIAWFEDIGKILAALYKVEEKDILGNSKAQGTQPAGQ